MKLLFAILFFIPFTLISQESLEQTISKYNSTNSTIEKAKYASDIAWGLKDINPDSSLYYAEMAQGFSKETGQKEIEAYSLSDIGNYYKRREDYKTALRNYLSSLTIRKELGKPKIIAAGYNQIGLLYKQQEKYDSAIVFFSKGISEVSKTEHLDELLRLYDGYAMTLYHLGNAESALAYLDTTFILANQIDDDLTIAKSVQNKGVINQYLGRDRLALKFYKEAELCYKSFGNINGQIEVMINQASILLNIGKDKEAERLLLNAEKQSIEAGFRDNLFIIYLDLGQLYKSDNIELRKAYLQKAYENAMMFDKIPAQIESGIELGILALKTDNTDEVLTKINAIKRQSSHLTNESKVKLYQLESNYWADFGNYKRALNYSQKAFSLKDSLFQNLNDLQDLSSTLENERYEKELALEQLRTSRAEKVSIQAKRGKDKIFIWALILGIALLSLLYFTNRKRLKIKHEKELQEERFQIALKEKEYETDHLFFEEVLSLETEIRKKIGRDLHDHLGSKLAVVQITLESIESRGLDGATNQLKEAIDLVDKSCKDVREISHDLIEHEISKYGLDKLFVQHCSSISKSGFLEIEYSTVGNPYQLPLAVKKHLYTTVILLVDNIIKHAKAHKASLQLFYHDDCINVQLDDDGIGMRIGMSEKTQGFGLINAKERIEKIKGTIEIDSPKNNGTLISISVPINDG